MLTRVKYVACFFIVLALTGGGAFYFYHGLYGLNVLLRRGGTVFVTVTPDDARLTSSMRAALAPNSMEATADQPEWRALQPGLETAELPVLSGGREVDRILLARIDPARFRFEVMTAPAGNKDLGDWMRDYGPTVIINGSYFDRKGRPDTPVKSAGMVAGPANYNASHGIFVVSVEGTGVHDLRGQDWRPLLDRARDAMISYPLLLARDRSIRVNSDRRWLANRSFVAQDRSGRIVLGTTKDAFFSLERLAVFLRDGPLDLTVALNLDGGPLACQAVKASGFERDFCGDWETQTSDGDIILLQRIIGERRWALPIVLAAFPK